VLQFLIAAALILGGFGTAGLFFLGLLDRIEKLRKR
jgi:hypothetical protein